MSNIILIILTFVFLLIALTTLSASNIIINIKVPVNLWRLFNVYELLIIIGGLTISCGMGILLILNNNGFLTLNIDDEKRKKILKFGYIMSMVLFVTFMFYSSRRLSNPEDYKSTITWWIILEDIILTCGVGLIIMAYALSKKGVKKIEIIFSILNYIFFFISLLLFVGCIKFNVENNTLGVIVYFIINSICSLISIVISSISIFFGFKSKNKNKILIYINFSAIVLCIIMFILIVTVLL